MAESDYDARAAHTAAVREAALARFVPEVKRALAAAPNVRAWPTDWDERGAIEYFYRTKSILTDSANAANVRTALLSMGAYGEADDGDTDRAQRTATHSGDAALAKFDVTVRESQHTPGVLDDLDTRFG